MIALQPPTLHQSSQPDWSTSFQEFVPQSYESSQVVPQAASHIGAYDPFAGLGTAHAQQQLNPYASDAASLAGAAYFHSAGTFAQPVRYFRVICVQLI